MTKSFEPTDPFPIITFISRSTPITLPRVPLSGSYVVHLDTVISTISILRTTSPADPEAPSLHLSTKRKTKTKIYTTFCSLEVTYYDLMGNCLRCEGSTAKWAGEEWDFLATDSRVGVAGAGRAAMKVGDEKEGLLGDCDGGFASSSREVKIKITKKQLEELLGKADIKELTVQQVLSQLIDVGDKFHEAHHRPWRPVLQSIPEVN